MRRKPAGYAALVVTPYYNKPMQEGLDQHFKAINDAIDIRIFIYIRPLRGRHECRHDGGCSN